MTSGGSEKDPKDRLGDKLRDKEKAQEDRFFAEKEKELLRRLKERLERERGSAAGEPEGVREKTDGDPGGPTRERAGEGDPGEG